MAKEAGKKSFLDFFKVKDLDDDDEFDDDLFDDDEDEDFDDEVRKPSRSAKKTRSSAGAGTEQRPSGSAYSSGSYQSSSYSSTARQQSAPRPTTYGSSASQSGKLVDINAAQRPRRTAPASNEVYVIKPTDLSDAQTVADFLNNGMAIVINMEGLEITLAQRIIDIVFGAVYSMGGSLSPISNNIFIAAPNSVDVTGDLRNEILNQTLAPQFTR